MKQKIGTISSICMISCIFIFLSVYNAQGMLIEYDASVVPDDPSLQNVFSTEKQGGTNWVAAGGELTITTGPYTGIWFGNGNPDYDPVPWAIANSSEGNFLSFRAKLGSNADTWIGYLNDDSYSAWFNLMPGYVNILGFGNYTIDTSIYHNYSFHLANGEVDYRIDDNLIFSGSASSSFWHKSICIGDTWSSTDQGYGSMIIDEVRILTHAGPIPNPVPEPSTCLLFLFGILGMIGVKKKFS